MRKYLLISFFLYSTFFINTKAQVWDTIPGRVCYSDSICIGGQTHVEAFNEYNNKLYMGGFFFNIDSLNVNHVASLDGTKWDSLGSGIDLATSVQSFTNYNNELYMGGEFVTSTWPVSLHAAVGGVPYTHKIAKWNGNNWSSVGGGIIGPTTSVKAMAVYNGKLYAGGNFTNIGGINPNCCIATWDGANWAKVGGGAELNGSLEALAIYNDQLYAGGYYTSVGGIAASGIARWDGSQWDSVGMGVSARLTEMVVDTINNLLFIGGSFYWAGGILVNFVAKWDGVQWSDVSGGLNSAVYSNAMAIYHNELYVGGDMTMAGNTPVKYIARWDGSRWDSLGSGANAPIEVLTVYNDTLYVGGYFTIAGGLSASYIAKWYTPNVPTCLNFYSSPIGYDTNTVFLSDAAFVQFYHNSDTLAALSWYWDFGNGAADTIQNPLHKYDSAGVFTVMLITTCGDFIDTTYTTITVIDDVTGIKEFEASISNFKIYPNPAGEGFIVECEGEDEKMLKIYSIIGVKIKELTINSGNQKIRINTQGWGKGEYVCRLEVEGKAMKNKKIVIK